MPTFVLRNRTAREVSSPLCALAVPPTAAPARSFIASSTISSEAVLATRVVPNSTTASLEAPVVGCAFASLFNFGKSLSDYITLFLSKTSFVPSIETVQSELFHLEGHTVALGGKTMTLPFVRIVKVKLDLNKGPVGESREDVRLKKEKANSNNIPMLHED